VILRWLATQSDEGRRYTEREVNEIVQRHHPDFATLRRELVGARLMQREKRGELASFGDRRRSLTNRLSDEARARSRSRFKPTTEGGRREARRPRSRECREAGCGVYPCACAALIMSNMGRYMATTMPPITTPITTIMMGSRIEVSAPTAASTSSS
jgi:hypothetical protein